MGVCKKGWDNVLEERERESLANLYHNLHSLYALDVAVYSCLCDGEVEGGGDEKGGWWGMLVGQQVGCAVCGTRGLCKKGWVYWGEFAMYGVSCGFQ